MTDHTTSARPLAVVTGASSGIGYELAKLFANDGYDLIIAADRPLAEAEQVLRSAGAEVTSVQADLATKDGVHQLVHAIEGAGRSVDALCANAGHGLGHAFLDQNVEDWLHVINTNVVGTTHLVWHVGRMMRDRGRGRILITSSIASQMPGTFQAVYNATKSYDQSFAWAIRNELKDSGVSVTALLPGVTDTNFFERGELLDTKVGQDDNKDDPADVARTGYEALMKGEGDVVHGLKNKLQVAAAKITPDSALAEQHRGMAEPGSGR